MTAEKDVSDGALAARAAAGDRASFSALVGRHYDFVFRLAYRLTGRREDAEDVAQDVCMRLGSAIRGYRGGGKFTTWLYALTLNAVRDAARKGAREAGKARAFGVQALIDAEAAPEPETRADALWEAVRLLPPRQRDAVTLVYGEGLSHDEAADILACSAATVSWHVHEARKRLKQIMSAGEV